MPIAVFDVLGTLFAFGETISTISDTFPNLPAPPKTVFYLWMWSSLRDFFAASHAGPYVPFINILRAGFPRTLRFLEHDFTQNQIDTVLASLKHLKPEVGAVEGIKRLVENGWEVWGLTNGGRELARELLEKGGLLEFFTSEPSNEDNDPWDGLKIVSCDDIKVSKPHPKVYSYITKRAMRQSGKIQNMYMIATHAWDLGGAKNCGMRTVFLTLEERIYLEGDIFSHPPDVTGDTMLECIEQMMATDRRRSIVTWDGPALSRALPPHLLDKMD